MIVSHLHVRLTVNLLLSGQLLMCAASSAGELRVAVASNFLAAARELASEYGARSGHEIRLSSASTGKLYAQIVNGAPFDVFLAANTREPARLEAEGYALPGSRFTYAIGRLALWSADAERLRGRDAQAVLAVGGFRNLALANPRTAPYGAAAMSVMQALELFDSLRDKLIFGENIGQAYQFVASGNAELGFVARSQLVGAQPGSYWVVPQALYPELRQQYVVLSAARSPGAAWQFVAWLRSPRAREIIERFGYGTEPPSDAHESEGATPNGAKKSRID